MLYVYFQICPKMFYAINFADKNFTVNLLQANPF